MPKLSICIGTYNRAEFLRCCLDSIVPQATDDCEIVISDNASTDSTAAIVEAYRNLLPNLRYIRHSVNVGLDRNFDLAVRAASGVYCWLFSDDDTLRPGAIQ